MIKKFKLSVSYYLDFKLMHLQILVYTYQHIKPRSSVKALIYVNFNVISAKHCTSSY